MMLFGPGVKHIDIIELRSIIKTIDYVTFTVVAGVALSRHDDTDGSLVVPLNVNA